MVDSYYNIDDILAEAELVPCEFATDAIDLGYLNQNINGLNVDDEEDLKAGSIIELPFWLASSLASRRYVLMELPRIFQPKNRNAIAADPTVVDFSEKCTYFYEIGMKMAALSHDESIADILRRCLNIRYQEIVKRTANRKQTDQNDFLAKLASLEKQLFDAKLYGVVQYLRFSSRASSHMHAAPSLQALRSIDPNVPRNTGTNSSSNTNNITNNNSSNIIKPISSAQARIVSSAQANAPLPSHQRKRFGMARTSALNTLLMSENNVGNEENNINTVNNDNRRNNGSGNKRKRS